MILNETVAAIAEAIREKTGKSELIKPIDFAEEIKGISVGGGESGDSNVEYLVAPRTEDNRWGMALTYSRAAKASGIGFELIGTAGVLVAEGLLQRPQDIIALAVAFDDIAAKNLEINFTVREAFEQLGFTTEELDAIPRLTKEQFYDLNA